MSTSTIFIYAVGVFTLMLIGIVLTTMEFKKLADQRSRRRGVGGNEAGRTADRSNRSGIRVVHSRDAA